jgi:predicted amidophosphoribosyltransferase
MPKTNMGRKILEFISIKDQASPKEILEAMQISNAAVHRQLRKLEMTNKIQKVGTPPLVYYHIIKPLEVSKLAENTVSYKNLTPVTNDNIENNFIYTRPDGVILSGWSAFDNWLNKQKLKGQNLDRQKTADEYSELILRYNKYRDKDWLIDATAKLKSTFDSVFLDKLYYIDFYSYERFGKSKLAELTFLAKQTENKTLVQNIAELVKVKILNFIITHKIDCIAYVPPTAKRKIQFMHELEKDLSISLPICKIQKLNTPIRIQQKSIRDLNDRVENADTTFVVTEKRQFNNILLIDDFVGSGSSMNVLAKKIIRSNVAHTVFGLALTGSLKGFEVINQV